MHLTTLQITSIYTGNRLSDTWICKTALRKSNCHLNYHRQNETNILAEPERCLGVAFEQQHSNEIVHWISLGIVETEGSESAHSLGKRPGTKLSLLVLVPNSSQLDSSGTNSPCTYTCNLF